MKTSEALRHARRKAGLTQRALAARSGVAQSAIARIESGRIVPRVDSLGRLLDACGQALAVRPKLGAGVDRTVMTRLRRLTPAERLDLAAAEAKNLDALLRSVRRR